MNSRVTFPFNIPDAIIDIGFRAIEPAFRTMQSRSSFPGPQRIIQKGLSGMHTVLTALQTTVQAITGQNRQEDSAIPPVDGPQDINAAVDDFANRLACIARITAWQSHDMSTALREALAAARESFGYLDLSDPRNLAFPLQFVLSMGTLLVEAGLRGLVSYEALGADQFPKFCVDIFEIFTDN